MEANWIILKDGRHVAAGYDDYPESAALGKMHELQSASASHAIQYEGYAVEIRVEGNKWRDISRSFILR